MGTDPEQLNRFRQAVSRDASSFRKILDSTQFKRHFGQVTGDRLKTVPQGYPADHPEIELLGFKQVCVMEKFDDDNVVSPRFEASALESLKSMKPFIDYLNRVVGE